MLVSQYIVIQTGKLSAMRSDIVKEDYTSFSSLEVEECPIISIFSGAEQLVWSAWPGGRGVVT